VGEKGVSRIESAGRQGFFRTAFPFSQTQMGVPSIRATIRARRRGLALFTDSKNRLSAAANFLHFTHLLRLIEVYLPHYRKPSTRPLSAYKAVRRYPNFCKTAGSHLVWEPHGRLVGFAEQSCGGHFG